MIDTESRQRLREKIGDVLKRVRFADADDIVDVSEGDDIDDLHVVVVSRQFAGRGLRDRTEFIWAVLFDHLSPEEWGRVSLAIGATPERMNGATIESLKML